jgi:flavin-dependent dehydrogenase
MVPYEKNPAEEYDVAILGGGLAGLTLGLQLKDARPEISIFTAEKRPGLAPEAAFKVGESTQAVACNYFGEVLGLTDHMEKRQVRKSGLRFWFSAGDNRNLAERIELGGAGHLPAPSWQFDRGRFENFLMEENVKAGVDVFQGAFITDVEVGDPHVVTIVRGGPGGEESKVKSRWLVDASGRAFILKRKLGLLEDNNHNINSSWFRVAGGMDLEDWAPQDDEDFWTRVPERGFRKDSTNHLCGKGYWVWMIPLASGPISIGICADPRVHPWDRMDTLERALDWIREYEPQLGEALDSRGDDVEDFLKVENFSYGCKQEFDGTKRWALVGEAGAFLDPFYSPGSDFISIANTLTTDLITRELDGEDVTERAMAHDDLYLKLYMAGLAQYEDQYAFWGNPVVMSLKIPTNNLYYWGVMGLLFFHRKLTDLDLMEAVRPDVERTWAMNNQLEALFREWHDLEEREYRRAMIKPQGFPALFERHKDMIAGYDDDQIKARLRETADIMEAMAVIIFHRAARNLGDAAPGEDKKINPYAVSLDPERWEQDGLFSGKGLTLAEARQTDAAGVENLFMEAIAQPA